MEIIFDGIKKAFILISNLNSEVSDVTLLSIKVSGIATIVSVFFGILIGAFLALTNFPGRRILVALVNTGMGVPPVVVGLVITMFLWRNGPFGFLEILYTPWAIILAQILIATPIVSGITLAGIQHVPGKLKIQIKALGATRIQFVLLLLRETRFSLFAATMAGFGGVISEVGASMMVGGNIKGYTRVLTTATVLETSRGNFDMAMALSVILFCLTFIINQLLTFVQQRERRK
ncbi:MAG: ABC transporter permease [Deltaproteobacteria bacterium]|nr:ABC transporter permease [Deltaproteobacteria bacterium]